MNNGCVKWVSKGPTIENEQGGKLAKVWKVGITKFIIWKWRTHFRLQRDETESNEVSFPASHRERSKRLFRIEEPWNSDSELRNHEIQTSACKSSLPLPHTKPLSNISERPRFEYQTLDKEGFMQSARGTDSRQGVKVLLVVESWSREAYRLKSSRSKVPRYVRFKKRES